MNATLKNILLMPFNLLYKISPKAELKLMFRLKQGYKLNLDNPVTFNEKLQWLKLNNRDERMSVCCDKYTVRQYVESCGCSDILCKLYWSGFSPEEIPFDELPDKFVIKVTHGCGMNIICKNKNELDRLATIRKLKKWLKIKFIPCYGEWFYGVQKPRVIVEEFISSGDDIEPVDYKFFCFDGKAKSINVHSDRFSTHKKNVFDIDWKFRSDVVFGYKQSEDVPLKPEKLDEMIEISEKLSKGFPHVRVDLYNVGKKIYFGEMTFATGAGFNKITPYKFDVELGSHFNLPIKEDI